ncbi:MAG TPA: hypothetical protein VHG92_11120 [Afifellaceae bacterium]|nr:hypothetical protein [Afifellaceae bacterium]
MRKFKSDGAPAIALAAVLMVGAATGAWAQTVPFEGEGPIDSITANADGSGSMSLMGIPINIPAGLTADTPTAQLTIEQLADPTPLPGRSQPGFIGGTGAVTGNSEAGVATASTVFVEAAENVIVGEVTANTPVNGSCTLAVQGVEVVFSSDPRMPFGGGFNEAGFEIDPCSIPVGGEASVEGYLGEDGRLYAFIVESDAGTVTEEGNQVSITRAECGGGRLEIRGSATQSGTVTVFNHETNVQLGATTVDTAGQYRFRGNVGTCPSLARVEDADGNFAVSAVDAD